MATSLIVQPWFTAVGHPAQSTLNTAKALGAREDVGYLISDPHGGMFEPLAAELGRYGPVTRFRVPGDALRAGTALSLLALLRRRRRHPDLERVFFLDAHLLGLAALWPLVSRCLPSVGSLSVVHLGGPEHICARPIMRTLISRLLLAPGRRLFLRTKELESAWRSAFPEVPKERMSTIPSLEIPDEREVVPPRENVGRMKFGVIGQVRPGKSLEWLVPLFRDDPEIGELHVAGAFSTAMHRSKLQVLEGYSRFDNRFLTEEQLLATASAQDYLVALYDDWDPRMEAATVFLAARVGRPVIVYDQGWPGRMVHEFGCGIAVERASRLDGNFFAGLPRPGEATYRALLTGLDRFRNAHGGASSRRDFISKVLDE